MSAPAEALPDATPRRRPLDFIDALWAGFTSPRLTLALLALLTAACALGNFSNPALRPLNELRPAIGHAWWYPGYQFFELNDAFHSWWFVLLIVGFALNLAASVIERFPSAFLNASLANQGLHGSGRQELERRFRFKSKAAPTKVAADVAALLHARGFASVLLPADADGAARVFGTKGRASQFGWWGVPFGVLLILAGALLGRWLGKDGFVDVPMDGGTFDSIFRRTAEGSVFKDSLGFTGRVDDFRLLEYGNGSPRAFETDLSVLDPLGKPVARDTLRVGAPFVYDGWTVYQSNFQTDPDRQQIRLGITDLASKQPENLVHLAKDGDTTLADGVKLRVTNATDHFDQLGPAVQIERTAPNGRKTSFWVFKNYPDFDAKNRGDRYGLRYDGIDPFYVTGLQIARDPGYPLWLAGCGLLVLGLGFGLYGSHRRIWATVQAGELVLAGRANQGQAAFERAFADLAAAVEKGVA